MTETGKSDTDLIREFYKQAIRSNTFYEAKIEYISKIISIMTKLMRDINEMVNLEYKDSKFMKEELNYLFSLRTNLVKNLTHSDSSFIVKMRSSVDPEFEINTQNLIKSQSIIVNQFCDIVDKVFTVKRVKSERMSEILFYLLDLEYQEEADLLEKAIKIYEVNKSNYEFCGKIRSLLEKIVIKIVNILDEKDRNSLSFNLHTLKKHGLLKNKMIKVISSNYSYGSQFIHQEDQYNQADVKIFVDQTLIHIENLIAKIKELKKEKESESKNQVL